MNHPPILGTPTTHTLTILPSDDPYGTIEFSANFYSFKEGDLANITILRKGGLIGVSSVTFRISYGSATNEDFTSGIGLQGDIVFLDGVNFARLMIEIIDDTIPEDYENFSIVILPNVTGSATLGNLTLAEVQIEVSDDIFGVIGFSESSLNQTFDNPSSAEGPIGYTLSIQRERGTLNSVTVHYVIYPTDELQQVNTDYYFMTIFMQNVIRDSFITSLIYLLYLGGARY